MAIIPNTDLADIDAALFCIPADLPRPEWVQVLMAVKNELGEDGFQLADEWSKHSDKYKAADMLSTWKSIKSEGGITVASLFKTAQENGYKPKSNGQANRAASRPVKPPVDEAEAARKRQASIDKATAYYDAAKPCKTHPHFTSKGVKPIGLRQKGNAAVARAINRDGQIQSAQRFYPNGKKKNLPGCSISGCYFPIGTITNNTAIVVESVSTGLSVNEATELCVFVTFGKTNIPNIAGLIREKKPELTVILSPDNDPSGDAIRIAERAAIEYGCKVVYPQFPEGMVGTDWNDLHQGADLGEVKRQIESKQYSPSEPEPNIQAVALPEPSIIFPEYPLEALGPVLSEAAQAIANTVQAPRHLAGQSVLAATALAVQAHANVGIDNRIHPLSLYELTLGESGERKSWTDRLALKQHREWERKKQIEASEALETYRNELDTWNADRKKALQTNGSGLDGFREEPVQPLEGTFICEEPTLEGLQRSYRYGLASQGQFTDEGGQFFGGYAMNTDNALKTMAGLSKFWDGAPIIRTRAAVGESWAGYNRRLTSHLMVQSFVAYAVLGDELMQQQGYLPRYLIATGNNLFGRRQYSKPCPNDLAAIDRYHAALKPLLEKEWKLDEHGGLLLHTIKPTAAAMKLWVIAYNAIEEELADGGEYKAIRAAASKMAENIARMAGVMSVFAGYTKIKAETMNNAITLGDYYLDQYLLNTRSSKNQRVEDEANRLLGWLKSLGTQAINVDTISRYAPTKTGARGSVDRARAMMLRLAASGSVRCTKFNTRDLPAEWEIS